MNSKKSLSKIVILILILFMSSIIVFNCFKQDDKKIENALVDSVDNKYFSSARIKNKKNINEEKKAEELKVLVFSKKKDNTIRVVFNEPLLYDEEVGKVFNRLFFYFSPGIKGKFITRSDRIIDFFPSGVEYNESFLIIPKDLYGINGNSSKNEIKINITFNNSKDDILTFFNNKEDQKEKILNISSLLKTISSYDYKKIFEPPVFKVTSEIDLNNSRENSIDFSGDVNVKRYYKKIEKNDVPNIIKNIDTPLNIKNYFLSKGLNTLSDISGTDTFNKITTYVPSTKEGIYFCYQEVKENDNKNNFFQLYNFSTDNFIAFDTEKSILIWDKSKRKDNAKFSIYSSSGKIIDEFSQNSRGLYKIKNNEYTEIFIFKESAVNSLYRIKLNKIAGSDYNIFSLFDDSDEKSPAIAGIITNRDGSYIKDVKSLKFSFKIISNSKNILQDMINNIGADGSFKYIFKKNIFGESNLSISYYINEQLLKRCLFKSPQNDSQFFINPEDDFLKLIEPKEDVIFNNAPSIFAIKENYESQIDSIFVNIKDENNKNTELLIDAPISKNIKINLPPEEGIYYLSFEFYLKNGKSLTNNLKVKKINSADSNKIIVYNNDAIKKENGNFIYEVYNPLSADNGLLILFNNDLHYFKEINLDNGYNKISIDSRFIINDNLQALVLLTDFNNRIIYNLKNNLISPEESNNLNVSIETENDKDFMLKTALSKSKTPDNKLYISYTPLNNDFQKNILNNYNDFIRPQIDYENIYPGRVIETNNMHYNEIKLKKYKNGEYNLNIFLKNEQGKILSTKKTFKNKKNIMTTIYGPDVIDILDKPEYMISIKNSSTNNITIDAVIKENSETMFSKQKVLIKANSEAFINYNLQKNIQSDSTNISVEISSQKRLIDKIEKNINFKKDLVNQSIEVTGTLYDEDKTSSYLKMPESDEDIFNIDLILSRDNSINILKSNPVLDNYFSNNFELDLLKYIDSYINNIFFYIPSNINSITKYYIKNMGVKRNVYDREINIDSTLMLLFSALIIPEINKYFDIDEIINYLTTNYKEKILASPLRIFILAEYGILFDSISDEFLTDIKNTHESILFYQYYKNSYLDYNLNNEANSSFDIFYGSYNISKIFYLLISKYFGENDIINLDENFIFFQYPIESIFEKLILIKEKINKKDNKNIKGEISFKSKKLGEFKLDLIDNDIFIKKYSLDLFGTGKNDRIIDYTLEKNFNGPLNYNIKAYYKTKPVFTENSNIYLYSEWCDESGDIIDKNNLELQKDMTYKINIYMLNNSTIKNIVIKPMSSIALDPDYKSFTLNGEKIFLQSNKDKYIYIQNLGEGLNIISFSVTPKYSGIFKVNGFILADLNDSGNFVREKDTSVKIINNFLK